MALHGCEKNALHLKKQTLWDIAKCGSILRKKNYAFKHLTCNLTGYIRFIITYSILQKILRIKVPNLLPFCKLPGVGQSKERSFYVTRQRKERKKERKKKKRKKLNYNEKLKTN